MPPLLIPARNASEWTGPAGNNTWLLLGPAPALVDAGVGHPDHLADIERALGDASLARVFVTHRHSDHVKGLPALLARWPDAAVVDATHLADEGGLPAGSTTLRIIPTPGHAPDHLCFFDHESGDLYGGDLVRLEGSIVIPASQRGNLRDYLASLRRVRDLHPRRLLPGHGPIVDDPIALIDQYIAHREMRDQQILAAIASGARTTEEIVDRVYPGLPATLKRAAADTVEAHLEKLKEEGKV